MTWMILTKRPRGTNAETNKKKDKNLTTEYGISISGFKEDDSKYYRYRGEACEKLYNAFSSKDNYYYFEQIPMRYDEEEEKRFSDLENALNSKRDEYIQRFFTGNMDPANDADWATYISDMNKVGLQEFCELQTTVYYRTKAAIEQEQREAQEAENTVIAE